MSQPVNVSVRSQLSKIIDDLSAIRDKGAEVNEEFKKMGDDVAENARKNTKQAEGFLNNLRGFGRRAANQLRKDFASLISVNALTDSFRLTNQFRQVGAESVDLNNQIRKLGTTFGVAGKDFAAFQTKLTKGLGEIGLSSEVASNTLEGLATTPVRGQDNIVGYARTAGMLASIAGEQGSEGDIARSIARVIQARGGNVNDMNQVSGLGEEARKVFVATGASPTKTLSMMENLFANMPEDLRKAISASGLTNLAAAGAVGGPNATKFLEEYLGKSPIARMAFEAQGGKGVFTDKGLDVEKFRSFAQGIMGRVGGDPRLAAQTLGLSEEAAEGFVRLAENLDKVKDAQEGVARATGNLNNQYRSSLGLGEAFKANINRVKRAIAEPLSTVTQGATDLLSKASETDAGAAAVVAGGAGLAALLTGVGLKGIGKGLGGIGGTLARKEAAEGLTGEKTIPVYVVNASEIGGGGLLGPMGAAGGGAAAGGGMALLRMLGAAGLAGAGGYMAGSFLSDHIASTTQGVSSDGAYEGDAIERLMYELHKLLNQGKRPEDQGPMQWDKATGTWKIIVENKSRDIKATAEPARGASN